MGLSFSLLTQEQAWISSGLILSSGLLFSMNSECIRVGLQTYGIGSFSAVGLYVHVLWGGLVLESRPLTMGIVYSSFLSEYAIIPSHMQ